MSNAAEMCVCVGSHWREHSAFFCSQTDKSYLTFISSTHGSNNNSEVHG